MAPRPDPGGPGPGAQRRPGAQEQPGTQGQPEAHGRPGTQGQQWTQGQPGVRERPGVAELIEEGRRPGLPGMLPSRRFSLAAVPALLLGELAGARRGVVVLGVDGLSHRTAVLAWTSAEISYLTSTFPSTSAPAWLTACTGV